MYLVTGGAGFFGSVLVKKLLGAGCNVICFDINKPNFEHERLHVVQGDIRDRGAIRRALQGVKIVFHAVAQVPIAKNKTLFWSVNRDGTKSLLEAALAQRVRKVVYLSSSAVYGIPETCPITASTKKNPLEDYGRAKLAGEALCEEYRLKGLSSSIIRPRTILGSGRLGIFQILFEWTFQGKNIPVLGDGSNVFQFVHSDDLASACLAAAALDSDVDVNIGCEQFGSMRETLEHLTQYAATGSAVVPVPFKIAELGMNCVNSIGLSPLGKYHALMYGRDFYFDCEEAVNALQTRANISNNEMFIEAYDWYSQNRNAILEGSLSGSKHQSAVRQGILAAVPHLLFARRPRR